MADQRVTELVPVVVLDANALTNVRNPGDTRDKSTTIQKIIDLVPSPPAEVNDLSAAVTWVNVPDANITQSSVTQHQAALSVTASQVSDFDTEVSNNPDVTANSAKVTNATHTGEVTGSGALAADPTIISNKSVVTAVATDKVLLLDATDGLLKAADVNDFLSAGVSFPEFQFFADQMQNPVTADWAVNALAPVAADSLNSGLPVRLFDDSIEEGAGFILRVPSGLNSGPGGNSINFQVTHRAQTAPGAAQDVRYEVYTRQINDNALTGPWDTGVSFGNFTLDTNVNWQTETFGISLFAMGNLDADVLTQFQITRDATDASDTLVGDLAMLGVKVFFT